mgnify:CR=1 FL=1
MIPGAAESWEYNEDATEVTFTLREGLTYSDGSLLNAQRWYWASLNSRMTAPFESGQAPGGAVHHGRRPPKSV